MANENPGTSELNKTEEREREFRAMGSATLLGFGEKQLRLLMHRRILRIRWAVFADKTVDKDEAASSSMRERASGMGQLGGLRRR